MLAVEIIVPFKIDRSWCEWLGGLAITYPEPGRTILTGVMPDHAAVYGVLSRLRDLGLPLSSVRVETVDQ